MAQAISTPADVVNASLGRIGYTRRVADLYDGSDAASHALDIYGQTLDVSLRDGDYGFAQRQVTPTLLKAAPSNYFDAPWSAATNPPMPWQFSYQLPDDYLKVRSVRPQPGFLLNVSPTPTLFNVVNDNGYEVPLRVLVCNVPTPILVYTGRVTDPGKWSADFIEVMITALARRLAPVMTDMNAARVEAQDEAMSVGRASMEQG